MPRVTCAFCGLPFSVRAPQEGVSYYCCSGCALAQRIIAQGGGATINRGMILALVLAFGLFNEILFAVFGAALLAENNPAAGMNLSLVSCAIGAGLLAAVIGFVGFAPQRRGTDLAAILIAAVVAIIAGGKFLAHATGAAVALLLAANIWLALWLGRGWLRRAFAKLRRDDAA